MCFARLTACAAAMLVALPPPAALAEPADPCAMDAGVISDARVAAFTIPAGCTVAFKAWGGGGGVGPDGDTMSSGGGGGFAALTRTALRDEAYLASVGGAGGSRCHPAAQGGGSVSGFGGGLGGSGSSGPYCGGGGGGGATVLWLGPGAPETPLLVAGGGGGSGSGQSGANGRPGGVGPFRAAETAGKDGDGSCGTFGGGGGGGGYPSGGDATQPYGGSSCNGYGGGGQNYAPGGWTAIGSDASPGNAGDPERPGSAGRGAAGMMTIDVALPGALVYRVVQADWTPDAFDIAPLHDVAPAARVESEPRALTGFDGPARVLVAGAGAPEVSVEARPWSQEEEIYPGQSLKLRQTASDEPGTSRSVLLLVGRTTVEWTVDTAPVEPRRLAVGCACSTFTGSARPIVPRFDPAAVATLAFAAACRRRARGRR